MGNVNLAFLKLPNQMLLLLHLLKINRFFTNLFWKTIFYIYFSCTLFKYSEWSNYWHWHLICITRNIKILYRSLCLSCPQFITWNIYWSKSIILNSIFLIKKRFTLLLNLSLFSFFGNHNIKINLIKNIHLLSLDIK